MATTTTDDGFHEIQLNGKQLVFLFMAVTVVSVVIFLSGVLVGRGVRADRGTQASETVADEAAEKAPPIPTTPSGGPPATSNEVLTYSKQLDGPVPSDAFGPEKQAASKPSTPAARETQVPPPSKEPAAREASASPAEKPEAPRPAPEPAKPAAPEPAPARAADVPAEPAGPGFTIQVAALRDRSEAEAVVRRLAGKGYAAYMVSPQPGTAAVYRVRVGKFKERREADTVAARLQKEERFKPWIVR